MEENRSIRLASFEAMSTIQFAFSKAKQRSRELLFHIGIFSAFSTEQYLRIRPVMEGFPDEASVGFLRELGIRYLIVDTTAYEDFDKVFLELEDLRESVIGQFGTDAVFELLVE